MTKIREQYLNNPSKYKQIVWDYNLKPRSFFEILNGERTEGWLNRKWATTRVLENVNYYDALNLVDTNYLKNNWDSLRPRIFDKNIQNGYDYLLRKGALSFAG